MNHHVRERATFVQTTPAFLARLDAMIEELIGIRDALDGDADLEPEPDDDDGDDEPTLGAPEAGPHWFWRHAWARGANLPGEAEVTMPATGATHGWRGESQDIDPRACGYATPDDAEDGHDAEDEHDGREA